MLDAADRVSLVVDDDAILGQRSEALVRLCLEVKLGPYFRMIVGV